MNAMGSYTVMLCHRPTSFKVSVCDEVTTGSVAIRSLPLRSFYLTTLSELDGLTIGSLDPQNLSKLDYHYITLKDGGETYVLY